MIEQFKEGLEDAQRAIELDTKNIKAHLLMGECLCMQAKREKEYTKIDTAITRMTKGCLDSPALTLCASQELRNFEMDITVCIRKAKKLRWMIEVRENEKKRLNIEARLEVDEANYSKSSKKLQTRHWLQSTLKSSKSCSSRRRTFTRRTSLITSSAL